MKRTILLVLGLLLVGCGATGTEPAPAPSPTQAAAEPPAGETATDAPPTEVAEATEMVGDPSPTAAAQALDHAELLNQILFSDGNGPEALAQIRESGDTRFVAGLIDAFRYRRNLREDIGFTLNTLTDQELNADWFEWVEWFGKHPEIKSFEGYAGWKANLFAQIDPNFMRFVHKDVQVAPDSRIEEIVWGGVRVDGIPALDNPTMIDPEEAAYLVPHERVFGVSINGDARAYPARFLDWHEMFNDIVGGEPVSLAY